MKTKLSLIAIVFLIASQQKAIARDYICFYLMNTEIAHTVEENGRQQNMRNRQLGNLATETANKEQWYKFRGLTEKINSRLNSVSLAIQAIPTSASIAKEIERTYNYQSRIYNELADAPYWIPLALNNQVEFIDQLQMNVRFIAGIVLSYGDINKMEKAERKILLEHAKGEFKTLRMKAYHTLAMIRSAKERERRRQNALKNWVARDKRIIEQIVKNAKKI